MMSQHAKKMMFSLSLASLCHFKNYALLTSAFDDANAFFYKELPTPKDFYAFCLNLVMAAVIFFAVSDALVVPDQVPRWRRVIGWITVAAAVILALFGFMTTYGYASAPFYLVMKRCAQSSGTNLVAAIALAAVSTILIGLAVRHRRAFIRAVVAAVLLVSPFALIEIGQSLRYAFLVVPSAAAQDGQISHKMRHQGGKTKVVFCLFDELDYRLCFVDRPNGLRLDQLDRLKGESVFFQHAYPPANNTLFSISSITSGAWIRSVKPISKSDALLTTSEGRTIKWSEAPTLFGRLKRQGASSTVLASYLPYQVVMGKDIDEGTWYDQATQVNSTGEAFIDKVINQNRILIETPALSPLGQSLVIKEDVARFKRFMNDATAILAEDRHELVYLHFPIPHSPNFYDRKKRDFSLANKRFAGYADSLALVDKTLGDLRKVLEEKGVWDRASVIVTSDHWFRFATQFDGRKDHRIPLLIKLPGQRSGVIYDTPVNTVLLTDLMSALATNKMASKEELLDFVRVHGRNLKPVEVPGVD